MEILKTKGAPDKYLWKDQKIKLTDLIPKLKVLPRSGEIKRVFYRMCPIYGKKINSIPTQRHRRCLEQQQLFSSESICWRYLVEFKEYRGVLVKFAVEDERVIPIHEWVETVKEVFQRRADWSDNVPGPEEDEEAWEAWRDHYDAITAELEHVARILWY